MIYNFCWNEAKLLTAPYEILGILATSFFLNIIPFTGPSNMLIAANLALTTNADPLAIGLFVALGSALAKSTHYIVTFFIGGFIGKERRKRLDAAGEKIRGWASLALFIVAVSPLPDEPIVVPLGLIKYNPVKFFISYFAGKLLISSIGAYLGETGQKLLEPFVSQEILVVASIIFTIVVTILLLKVDITQFFRRETKQKEQNNREYSQNRAWFPRI